MVILLLSIIILFLHPFPSFGLTKQEAALFISSLRNKNFCSERFLSLRTSDLKELILLLYSENCQPNPNVPLPKNPYGKLKVAEKIGNKNEAREIFKAVFAET